MLCLLKSNCALQNISNQFFFITFQRAFLKQFILLEMEKFRKGEP